MVKIRIIILILVSSYLAHSQSFVGNDFDITRKNFHLKLRDKVKLDCTSLYPIAEKPETGFPCIVYCHGFGKNKEDNLANAIIFSKFGFVTYTFSMRGQGNSEGESNLISRTEAEDLKELIDFIKKDSLVDINRIAVIGSSQGGIIPLMELCKGSNVKCTISDLISLDFASNWIENGCVKMSLLWSLSYDASIVRYNAEVKKYRSWILSKRKDNWDSLIYYLPKNRDFSKNITEITTPVFISNSFQDKFFSSNSIIENLTKFPKNSKFYFGGIEGHGSLPAEDEIYFHDISMNNWLDLWLNNIEPEEKSKYIVSFSSSPFVNNIWSYRRFYSDTSLFENPNRIKFYLHPTNIITELPYSGDTNSFIFKNQVNDTTYKMQDAINSEFKGAYFNSNFKKVNLIFDSEPLVWNYNSLGIPKLHLVYKSNKSVCQFNFQIYEVFSDGTSKFISSINYTDRNCNKKVKKIDINGDALGHIFTAHNKIRIILTNIDTREKDNSLRTNPYILPIFNSSINTIYIGGKEGSYIELPLKE
jgi:predicted acyl esterase